MNYIIVSATVLEIRPLLTHFQVSDIGIGSPVRVAYGNHTLHFLVTGIGMMHAAYYLQAVLSSNRFDHAVQVGIAGAFDRKLQIGEVVSVRSQQFGDLGTITENGFDDVFDLELADRNAPPYTDGVLLNNSAGIRQHPKLEPVSALSVNQVSSEAAQIEILQRKYNARIEVMEGIAFHFACLNAGQPFAEIRGISNHVEPRNKDNWDVIGAVEQVNSYMRYWLNDDLNG